MTESSRIGKPLTDEWLSWIRLNVARGCCKKELYNKCVKENGFDKDEVQAALDVGSRKDNQQSASREGLAEVVSKKSINNGWKEYLKVRLDQGATKEELFLECAQQQLDLDEVSEALGGYRGRSMEVLKLARPEFTKRTFQPRAWKLDTELLEIYEIPNFLTSLECEESIHIIDNGVLNRSVVTFGPAESRTSKTCHLKIESEDDIVARVEQKFQAMMGPNHDPACAEMLQGQRYGVGDYFHPHTDWFTPNTKEYETHCQKGGQRTWTVMVYLNNVEEGGGTKFDNILREFIPRQGAALAWNNLDADGKTPNPWTLHEATPVTTKGTKYVLTKWFRERPMI